jgi:hypothetical protein
MIVEPSHIAAVVMFVLIWGLVSDIAISRHRTK